MTGDALLTDNDWPSVLKNCGSRKRLSRRRLLSQQIKTKES